MQAKKPCRSIQASETDGHISPNLFAYSSLIFGLTDKGFMIEAKQVFDDMLKRE